MPHHKITKKEHLERLIDLYEDDAIFEVLETHEEYTLPDLIHNYDCQEYTIQHI